MAKPTRLYRTTIVIWSENPTDFYDLQDLAYQAQEGEMFCQLQECEEVNDSEQFPDTEFFDN